MNRNTFFDDFPELVTLDSHNCMDESVALALYTLEDTGIKQYLTRAYCFYSLANQEEFSCPLQETSSKSNIYREKDESTSEQCSSLWAVVHLYAKL